MLYILQDQNVILWKLYNIASPEPVIKILKEEIPKFEGPVWRLSWSLAGNMLAVSAANKESETQVYVYQVYFKWFI